MKHVVNFVALVVGLVAVVSLIGAAFLSRSGNSSVAQLDGSSANSPISQQNTMRFAACMRESGFEFIELNIDDENGLDVDEVTVDLFRADISRDTVINNGYGLASETRSQLDGSSVEFPGVDVDRNLEIYWSLDLDARFAYDEQFELCRTEFPLTTVLSDLESQREREEAIERLERLTADPNFLESLAGWSTCMLEEGHEFAEPGEPASFVKEEYASSVIVDSEWTPQDDPGLFPVSPPRTLDTMQFDLSLIHI